MGYLVEVSAAVLWGNGDSPFATLGVGSVLPFGLDVLLEDVIVASLCKRAGWLQVVEHSVR